MHLLAHAQGQTPEQLYGGLPLRPPSFDNPLCRQQQFAVKARSLVTHRYHLGVLHFEWNESLEIGPSRGPR